MAKPTADKIKSNIQAQDSSIWTQAQAHQRPDGLDIFEGDLAKAIAAAWSDVESGLAIASVPVTGGAAPPGGPLSAGVATLSPGGLTAAASFSSISGKFASSFPNGETDGVRALVSAIAQAVGQAFTAWATGYQTTLAAVGGSAAWVGPPSPSPGPWMGGSIQPAPIAAGSSAGDEGMTGASLEAAIGNSADPSKLKQNNNTLEPGLSALISAVAKGFEATWTEWKTQTKISGGTGTGTASPPAGSVVGAVASPSIS
jgi:hypothetical protein